MKTLRTLGSKLYRLWMGFAHVLAVVNTAIILALVYMLLIGPSWLIMRILGKDLLDRRLKDTNTYWKPKPPLAHTLEESRHQF